MLKSLFIMNSRDVMHITRQVMTGGDSMARVLLWLMLFWASGLQWAVIASGNKFLFCLPNQRPWKSVYVGNNFCDRV